MQPIELHNPPVVESVIDLRFAGLEVDHLQAFSEVVESYADSLPHRSEVKRFETTATLHVNSQQPSSAAVQSSLIGFMRHKGDHRVQLSVDGLNLGWLVQPYPRGDQLIQAADEALRRFRERFAGNQISRVGWRTINRIPCRDASYQQMARCVHTWSAVSALGYELSPPLAHVQTLRASEHPSLVATTATSLQEEPDGQRFLLVDVDAYTFDRVASLNETLNRLRAWKNQVFFDLLEDEVRTWLH